MATIGTIESFNPSGGDWNSYASRLDHYLTANGVDDADKKKSTLLTVIGSESYRLLENLLAPDQPGDKDYATICKTLKDHLCPKPLIIAERYRFHSRNQQAQESVSQYLAELRRLARDCDFDAYLPQALRDRFVCGIASQATRRKLLAEDGLNLAKAEKIALAMEAATRDAAEVSPSVSATSGQVNYTGTKKGRASSNGTCYRCGATGHSSQDCRFKDAQCNNCGKTGHIKRACRSQAKPQKSEQPAGFRPTPKPRQRKKAAVHAVDSDNEEEIAVVDTVGRKGTNVIWVTPAVNGTPIKMELDTGSAVSILPTTTFRKLYPEVPLQETTLVLRGYSGEKLKTRGVTEMTVNLNGQLSQLPLYVCDVPGPPLFGREWLASLKLDWSAVHGITKTTSTSQRLEQLKTKYGEIFGSDLGKLRGVTGKLTLQDNAEPKFLKARPLPYSLRPKVETELQRMEDEGIITRVEWSDWATPIVPVVKPNGTVRICGDFKQTVNPQIKVDQYPLPHVDDIFASLAGGQKFSKIDLKSAYTQMEMEDDSKPLLTLNTHRGLYRLNRLAFGIASAPALWQRSIDTVLSGLSRTKCIIDDIIITGVDDNEHLRNLETVFSRLQAAGLRVNIAKCSFFQDKIEYCGHEVSADGLRKLQTKIDAVLNAPRPRNVSQLRSFLGLVNYYQRFLPDLATVLHPLNQLLQKGTTFAWTPDCESAFDHVKKLIASDQVLTHYNPDLPVRLASDASPYGLGAVLSHVMPNGNERPIAFASRTLSPAEKGYAQIDKEALAIVWALKKFNVYLYGRHFELVTDHKPLVSIFNPAKGIPAMTAARLQRFALFLSTHDYDIVYRNTNEHANADSMSRLPQAMVDAESAAQQAVNNFHVHQIDVLPVTAKQIRTETRKDVLLARVHDFVLHGWPDTCPDDDLRPYHVRRNEMATHDGCLLWGTRVVIPLSLRLTVLSELHEGHPGMVRMKTLARSYVWWPRLDEDIEQTARSCLGCQQTLKAPTTAPLHPWEWPAQPWQRIHVDFAGPVEDFMWLIAVDAHSKWPEVMPMKSTTATATIQQLRKLFAQHGIPEQLVSDNGPQFVSDEFASFLKANGIRHIRSAPYHPATNGLAERFVQTFKNALKASSGRPGVSLNERVAKFLLSYRNTPHATTNASPAMLLFKRPLRTRLDLVRPDFRKHVSEHQFSQASGKAFNQPRNFQIGEAVQVRDYRQNQQKWQPGIVSSTKGPLSYEVEVNPHMVWRRHADQMQTTDQLKTDTKEASAPDLLSTESSTSDVTPIRTPENTLTPSHKQDSSPCKQDIGATPLPSLRRYPSRERKAPKRLTY